MPQSVFTQNRYRHAFKAAEIATKIEKLNTEIEAEEGVAEDEPEKAASAQEKIGKLKGKIAALENEYKTAKEATAKAEEALAEAKKAYADDEEFQQYEAMLDDGVDLKRLKYKEMRLLRKDLQIIFQDPYSSLNPRMTVGQIIEEGFKVAKDLGYETIIMMPREQGKIKQISYAPLWQNWCFRYACDNEFADYIAESSLNPVHIKEDIAITEGEWYHPTSRGGLRDKIIAESEELGNW